MSLPDVWYLCDEKDWLDLAAGLYEAGEYLSQLRIMSLETKMEFLLMEVRTAERNAQDTTALVTDYTDAMRTKQSLQTKEGRLKFIDQILVTAYEKRKQSKEEVLPL